jgi:hypothetical protein
MSCNAKNLDISIDNNDVSVISESIMIDDLNKNCSTK